MAMKNDDNETSIILNVDANMDDLKYYAGTSNILKYQNPPIPRQLSSLTMSNFDAYKHRLKTFQLTVRGRWKKFVMGVFEVPCQISNSSDNDSIKGNDE
jgi:hypothetical protein